MPIEEMSRRSMLQTGIAWLGINWGRHRYINPTARYYPNVPLIWNNAALEVIRTTRPGVTVVARALAILNTCIYNAWAAYDAVALSTHHGQSLRRPPAERIIFHQQKAISYAAYHALIDLFPAASTQFQILMSSLGYDYTDTTLDSRTPAGIGNLSALAVLEMRHADGSNQLGDLHPGAYSDCTNYLPVNDPDHINNPNRWQPLRISNGKGGFNVQTCLTPQWRLVTPFALISPAQFRPTIGPASYPSALYIKQAEQMLRYSAGLTDIQKAIAEYWRDGPNTEQPPGHWCLFAQLIVQRDNYSLDQTVKLFFILTNALLDASIACWDTKFAFDSERPITAIHYLFRDQQVRAWGGPYQGSRWIEGQNWHPYQTETFVTPAFPEYCSGHSTFSAASAEILRRFTGSEQFQASATILAGTSLIEPGIVPSHPIRLFWNTFSEAADQAGLSRRYGGIHFEQGDLIGRRLGRDIGRQVWYKAQAYINRVIT